MDDRPVCCVCVKVGPNQNDEKIKLKTNLSLIKNSKHKGQRTLYRRRGYLARIWSIRFGTAIRLAFLEIRR